MFRKILRMGMHSPMAMLMGVVGLFVFQGITLHIEVDSESYRTSRPKTPRSPKRERTEAVAVVERVAVASGPEVAPTVLCPLDPLSSADHAAYEAERGPERFGGERKGLFQRLRER